MLYIELKNRKDNSTMTIEWHDRDGMVEFPDNDDWEVVEVQADGHEFAYIEKYFHTIPMVTNTRVVRWFGDYAKFIAYNLS